MYYNPDTSTGKEPRSYMVQLPNGSLLHRNRKHLLDTPQPRKSVTFAAGPAQTFDEANEFVRDLISATVPDNAPDPGVGPEPDQQHTRSGRAVKKPYRMDL